ncbi:uncharacterized protein N7477_009583 [Penicillium maclennaniae]|uniref:uncharacterized protein n=1 Tax=Penicillium maclennaniae TaxID=1343394 RepID=UPI002541F949|nr:uncharacterized protein N7477_009583 [Penicillium maclennaniae]KAJ5661967.1 hypothetical protein N7477_009583 [Penicillium maclennaniae]
MTTLSTSRGLGALAVSAVFTSLATMVVLIRVYTRAFMVKQMGADDYAILASLVFSWVFFGLFVGEVYHDMGQRFKLIPEDVYVTQMICFWASVPIYQCSLFSTKISILLQYRRPALFFLGFIVVYGTWSVISAWANCVPLAKFWDPTVPGFCFDKKALWFSNSAIHILTDLLILTFPMPVLKSLQLPRKQKLALMGYSVVITTILRLHSLLVIANSDDPTYDNTGAAAWSAVECNVAIICASLPSTRAFLSQLLPHIFSTGSNGYRSKTRPSRTGRSALTGNTGNGNTQVMASVIGGREPGRDGYDLDDLSLDGSIHSFEKEQKSKDETFAGIKVTTLVTQESNVTTLGSHKTESASELV